MRTIQVDDEVYQTLEGLVQGFGDTPNTVLRRVLGVSPRGARPVDGRAAPKPRGMSGGGKRGKAPKANLRDLVRIGSLAEGQTLYMHDYQGARLEGVSARIHGNDLEYKGNRLSMSALTRKIMRDLGYQSDSYRGPQFWYTDEGKSVKELWEEYLRTRSVE